uniref:RNA-directed DNA polymerase n=1 Tax=Paracoccus sp. TRP TaxID=412597 RepID=UPI000314D05E|nr:RNA-directed DNA polymerase [Paracoccus sp. TRP]
MSELRGLILKALLSKGYFPKELPPVFTTKDFGSNADEIIQDWHKAKVFEIKDAKDFGKIGGKKFRSKYSYKKIPSADPEVISKPKKLYERRNIHVTHPIPQALLTKELAENWPKVQKWLSRQRYSEDEIRVSDRYERAIKGINFPIHRAKTSYLEATSDWLIKTDISRFYPTIYTHSIPWAAYGKERVKSALKTYEGTFADRLDLLVRSCNRNQTIGVPIGPETSRILAEIISSRIDSDFSTQLGDLPGEVVDRLQDDWTVGSATLERSEKILSVISSCYREYGLEINGSKTSISHILASDQESWKSEISAFLSHRRGGLYRSRLEEFLALCLRLQLEHPSAPVLNYALSIIEGRRFGPKDIEVLESFLLKAAAIAPISMDRVCRIILNIDHTSGGLSKERLAKRFTGLAERHFENGALFEVIWLLYTLRGLKKPIKSSKIMKYAENVQSSAIRLLLLDMTSKGLCVTPAPAGMWEDEINEQRILSDWSWLAAYEGIRKGWLKDKQGVMAHPFFRAMNDKDVVFYDPLKNVRKSASVKRDRSRERREQNLEVMNFLEALRGVDFQIDTGWSEY